MALEDFQKQLKELKKMGDAMELRAAEKTARPAAVADARSYLEVVLKSLNAWEETRPWVTEDERKEL